MMNDLVLPRPVVEGRASTTMYSHSAFLDPLLLPRALSPRCRRGDQVARGRTRLRVVGRTPEDVDRSTGSRGPGRRQCVCNGPKMPLSLRPLEVVKAAVLERDVGAHDQVGNRPGHEHVPMVLRARRKPPSSSRSCHSVRDRGRSSEILRSGVALEARPPGWHH